MSNLSPHEQFIQDNKVRIEQDRKVIKEHLTQNYNMGFGNGPHNAQGSILAGLVFKKNWTLSIWKKSLPEDFNLDPIRVSLTNLNTNWPVKINMR